MRDTPGRRVLAVRRTKKTSEPRVRRRSGLRERERAHRSDRRETDGRMYIEVEEERDTGWFSVRGVGRCHGDGSKAGKGKGGSVDANAP